MDGNVKFFILRPCLGCKGHSCKGHSCKGRSCKGYDCQAGVNQIAGHACVFVNAGGSAEFTTTQFASGTLMALTCCNTKPFDGFRVVFVYT